MLHRNSQISVVTALVLSALAGGATGAEIFKWIDDEGTVHYSDTKPAHTDAVETLRFESTNTADYDPVADPYSILNQAARVSDARAETQLESRARERDDVADEYADWGYTDYVATPYPAYIAPIYYPPRPLMRSGRHVPNAARQQVEAMQSLDVAGQRPHSINSGAHRARVQQSRDLPLATPGRDAGPNGRPSY